MPSCRVCAFAPGRFNGGQIGELEETPGLSAGAWQMRPLSRGDVEAKSNQPGDMPAINPRYLSEAADRRAIIDQRSFREGHPGYPSDCRLIGRRAVANHTDAAANRSVAGRRGRVDRVSGRYYGAPRFGYSTAGTGSDIALGRMSDGKPTDPLARLGEEIDKARAERVRSQPVAAERANLQQGLGLGFRIGIELVVAVVVGTGLGWAIDRWLGTRPWGMIVLFFLGVAAGMLNVYRAVTGVSGAAGYRRPESSAGIKRWDDEDC